MQLISGLSSQIESTYSQCRYNWYVNRDPPRIDKKLNEIADDLWAITHNYLH